MSNISALASLIARSASARKNTDSVVVGEISGTEVKINGRKYKAIWGGDFDVIEGGKADCVLSGDKCIVLRVSQ